MSLLDDIKQSFRQGDYLVRLIYINLGVFLLAHIIKLCFDLYKTDGSFIFTWLSIPASLDLLIYRPYSIFTYMFLHKEIFHILFNMIALYFGGRLFLEFLGERRLVTVYLLGGISGGLLYILFYNVFPLFSDILPMSQALGASASVLAIIIGIATYIPNFSVRLFFLLEVKLKYIALFFVIMDIVSITGSNAGGHIAHLGGAIFGYVFAKRYQRGIDWGERFFRWFSGLGNIFKRKPKNRMKVAYKKGGSGNQKKNVSPDQERIDRILDKISKSGYDSLSKEEKDILFRASKN